MKIIDFNCIEISITITIHGFNIRFKKMYKKVQLALAYIKSKYYRNVGEKILLAVFTVNQNYTKIPNIFKSSQTC